jgi:hypothetical protein
VSQKKYSVGDRVEVQCDNRKDGKAWSKGWVPGVVVEADYRMAAVRLECDVRSSNGWMIPDRTLWLAHGSKNIRPTESQSS